MWYRSCNVLIYHYKYAMYANACLLDSCFIIYFTFTCVHPSHLISNCVSNITYKDPKGFGNISGKSDQFQLHDCKLCFNICWRICVYYLDQLLFFSAFVKTSYISKINHDACYLAQIIKRKAHGMHS